MEEALALLISVARRRGRGARGEGGDDAAIRGAAEQALALLDRAGGRAVDLGAPTFPERLRDLDPPPPVVFLLGPWEPRRPTVAIVGARSADEEGRDVAGRLAADLAGAGVDVISGLARGIDAAAHRGALAAGGRSGAVLGTGIERRYPRENAALQDQLAGSLGLLSEVLPGAPPTRSTFASRNRLLAAMCDALIVVQGRASSGALLGARAAVGLGRRVGAFPWDARDPLGEAPHALIRSGEATLVRDAGDVVELLGCAGAGARPSSGLRGSELRVGRGAAGRSPTTLGLEALALLRALRRRPETPDVLAARSGLSLPAVLAALATLEIEGLARREPGGLARRARD